MPESTGETHLEHGQDATAVKGRERHGPWWRYLAVAIALGLLIGVLTLIGQAHLPGAWNSLTNTGGPWLIGAFFIGTLMPSQRWAAAAGLVTLLACLLGYYLAAHFFVDASAESGIVTFWVGTA